MTRIFLLLCLLFPLEMVAQSVSNLLCNGASDPFGIDDPSPRLSWEISSSVRGDYQTAYQVLVASGEELLAGDVGDLWNSGRISSDQSIHLSYAGKPLKSGQNCYWKVRVWNRNGKVTGWSPPAHWTMGLLSQEEWQAKWITASKWFTPPAFRPKGFELGPSGGWADIDLRESCHADSIVLYSYDSASFPSRFSIETCGEMLFKHPKILVNVTSTGSEPSARERVEFRINERVERFVRLRVYADSSRKQDFIVRQMEVYSGGQNVALMKFTREYGTYWSRGHAVFLVDGMPSHNEGEICPPDACPTTAAPLFRKSIDVPKPVKYATLSVAALGMADVSINGKKIGNEELGPPFTDYSRRIIYRTKDVTTLLQKGENVIGAILGNGFFSPPGLGFGKRHSGNGSPGLILQLKIEFADGTQQVIGSDDSWKWSKGEILMNDYWGDYLEDRRLKLTGWNHPRYDDTLWHSVNLLLPPEGKLCSSVAPPIRVLGVTNADSVQENSAKFGSSTAGWPQLKIDGKAGQTIVISGVSPGIKVPKLTFVLGEDGPTVLMPRFTLFPGTTEIKVEGLSKPLRKEDIRIQEVNADLKPAGSFSCSNPFLTRLFEASAKTYRNYIFDFPADPNREKQGWTQDAQNMFASAAYLCKVDGLYRKWWQDMADNQDSLGYLGSVVPVVNRQVYDWNSPWWSGAIVLLPWEHYLYYGDKTILESAFEPMRRYVDFLGKIASAGEGGVWNAYPFFTQKPDTAAATAKMIIWNGAGDWQNPLTKGQFAVPAPMSTMPAYFYYATIVSKTAALLGKENESKKYKLLAEDIRTRFNKIYLDGSQGLYGDKEDSQTGQVLPLSTGMVPKQLEDLVYKQLLEAIHANNDHIGTGFVATPFLLHLLAARHESVLANKMVNQMDYPGWNTLMKNGVLMENWKGDGVQMPSCGGPIVAWLFESVLGIQPDRSGPGFKKFILAPQPDVSTGLTSAKGYYDSPYGRIISNWKYENEQFDFQTTIPVNSTASLYLPGKDIELITESGLPLKKSAGIKIIKAENSVVVLEVGSGTYHFISKNLKLGQ